MYGGDCGFYPTPDAELCSVHQPLAKARKLLLIDDEEPQRDREAAVSGGFLGAWLHKLLKDPRSSFDGGVVGAIIAKLLDCVIALFAKPFEQVSTLVNKVFRSDVQVEPAQASPSPVAQPDSTPTILPTQPEPTITSTPPTPRPEPTSTTFPAQPIQTPATTTYALYSTTSWGLGLSFTVRDYVIMLSSCGISSGITVIVMYMQMHQMVSQSSLSPGYSANAVASASANVVTVTPLPVAIDTAPVISKELNKKLTFQGIFKSRKKIDIFPSISSSIRQVLVQNGQEVRSGEVIIELDSAALSAELMAAKAAVNLAHARLQQTKEAVQAGHVTDVAVTVATAELEQASASLELVTLKQNEATIRAPFRGIVTNLVAKVGDMAYPTLAIASVESVDPGTIPLAEAEVMFQVNRDQARWIQSGQLAQIRTSEHPGTPIPGTVASVVTTVGSDAQTFTVRVQPTNSHHEIRGGVSTTVEITGLDTWTALVIPQRAIRAVGQRRYVDIVEGPNMRHIQIGVGVVDDGEVEIIGPVSEGSRVLLAP